MGLCFSKKQPEKAPSQPPAPQQPSAVAGAKPKKPSKLAAAAVPTEEKAKKAPPQPKRASNADESSAAVGKKAAAPIVVKAKAAAVVEAPVVATVVTKGPAPVRTSSCTKEEVDAILIQCGRLSRSSSGTGMAASGETGGHRRHSGSKRSCDLDRERSGAEEEGDWERVPVSRPSPHRGSPQRKRSGSRERTSGGGSRRSSRSPGRRGEGAASASCGGARQQPGKMVSVPAREKGPTKRCASPRSSSPARVAAAVGNENAGVGQQKIAAQAPSLSRSSSRKAEQSPLRRSPMAEIDENSLRNNNNISSNAKPQKKPTEIAVATPTRKTTTERAKEQSSQKEKASETRAPPSSKTTTGTRTVSVVAESTHPRSGCRSRRASRDFDQNPNLYLLEDIQSYHTSAAAAATAPSFTLPACVSKAQSIVDAVADLNSSSSSGSRAYEPGRSADDKGSVNAVVGGDVDLAEPSVHKYVSVRDIRGRGETEMQESAGSNTLSGNVWTPSCESTDRTWSTSRSSNHGDEVVEQPRQSSKQRPAAQPEPSGRSRAGSSGATNNAHRGRSAHRGSGSGTVASGRSGAHGVVSASS
ncbi:uncharacterized protein At1g65710-like [Lolium rigidum]|uniref:uncharacterized protein At1g65710-like n=1 Tax=Lolium rigidum TaxID=89674 RepID=UPI001F5D6F8F|nr:uncharacterized protein At1g65710-like [Lolium rigidum]